MLAVLAPGHLLSLGTGGAPLILLFIEGAILCQMLALAANETNSCLSEDPCDFIVIVPLALFGLNSPAKICTMLTFQTLLGSVVFHSLPDIPFLMVSQLGFNCDHFTHPMVHLPFFHRLA